MAKFTLADFQGTWVFEITGPVVPNQGQGQPGVNPTITVAGTFTADDQGNIPSWTDDEFPGEVRHAPSRNFDDGQGGDSGQPLNGTDIQFSGQPGARTGTAGQLLLRFHQGEKGGLFGPWFPFEWEDHDNLLISGVAGPGLSYKGFAKRQKA